MGSYFIPGAKSLNEAAAAIGDVPVSGRTWGADPDGIWFSDLNLTDAECAALYAGFTPSAVGDDNYVPPKPAAVQAAIDILGAFYDANPASLSDTQSATIGRAVVIVLRWLNRSLG